MNNNNNIIEGPPLSRTAGPAFPQLLLVWTTEKKAMKTKKAKKIKKTNEKKTNETKKGQRRQKMKLTICQRPVGTF